MSDVSINEAAQRLGVSTETIRRRLHKGSLKGEQVTTPQGFVWTVDLPDEESQQEEHREDCGDLRELVATLRGQVEAQAVELAAKNEQIRELHVLLQQSQPVLPAGRPWWRFW